MIRKMRMWMMTASLGAIAAVSGVDCGASAGLGAAGYDDAWSYAADSAGDDYYGFYDSEGTGSFSIYPGGDPGDTLETYLGNSVVY
jgi:hypothetical protein